MLHEILLSLSGHPSPLLRTAAASESDVQQQKAALSPSERELLRSIAHLSDLHVRLRSFTAQIGASHPSAICRAVATAIDGTHLRRFREKVLAVEDTVLRKDAALVGAYNIVPLTAIVGEFADWTRRMEWLWQIVQFMLRRREGEGEGEGVDERGKRVENACTGAMIIDRLRAELQTGYVDIEEIASDLVKVAETAWLKQVSAWILYGRLPSFGADDFFVKQSEEDAEDYISISSLLPSFVATSTASSMLFIGKSLNHVRVKSSMASGLRGADHLSSQLQELARLTYPLDQATFARTVTGIRQYLSRTTLQKLLPLAKVLETLQLLREFFLLGRGEFAMALSQQADERIRNRWRRNDNLAYENRDGLNNVVVKEGEVSAVLSRTWAALGSMQGQHSEEDEGLELARELLRLNLARPKSIRTPTTDRAVSGVLATTPFRNLLFSVPVVLTMSIPSPLDLFLSSSDLEMYASINAYLMSIRRAHLRLTDLWKISSLRRHHPPPPAPPFGSSKAGKERVRMLRERYNARSDVMRSTWATSSAAIFFLAETEAYLQTEVVAGLWDGFQRWVTTGSNEPGQEQGTKRGTPPSAHSHGDVEATDDDEDIWMPEVVSRPKNEAEGDRRQPAPTPGDLPPHDPQSLAVAHHVYLYVLARRLLLTQQPFTDALYELLVRTDHLVALVHRLHGIWTSLDLEADAGVVDAFVDLEREERDVEREIAGVEARVKRAVEGAVAELRLLEADYEAFENMVAGDVGAGDGAHGTEAEGAESAVGFAGGLAEEEEQGRYVPRRVGGVDRLLMKLDFGSWFAVGRGRDDLLDDSL